jgi:hypothetical protein
MINQLKYERMTEGDESVNRIIEDFAAGGHRCAKVMAAIRVAPACSQSQPLHCAGIHEHSRKQTDKAGSRNDTGRDASVSK